MENPIKNKLDTPVLPSLPIERPWGFYTILEEKPLFKVKRIVVNAGQKLSLQLHHQRAEHWVVVSGTALVQNGESEITLQAGDHTFIPQGHKHRLSNPTTESLEIIEVQIGSYFGEDDIVRLEDQYGRR